jgi:hypothetical protein
MTEEEFRDIKLRWEKAAPEDKWTGTANIPFYVVLEKPRPSLSKHEGTKRGADMWHYDDGIFVACAKRDMGKLINHIDALQKLSDIQATALRLLDPGGGDP